MSYQIRQLQARNIIALGLYFELFAGQMRGKDFRSYEIRPATINSLERVLGHPFSPGHFVSSITYRDGLTALPWQG